MYCRQRLIQADMRFQRLLESECKWWNPALCILVSLLGSLVLVVVSVLLRQGESKARAAAATVMWEVETKHYCNVFDSSFYVFALFVIIKSIALYIKCQDKCSPPILFMLLFQET